MILKISILLVIIWHIGTFIYHWHIDSLKDAYSYAKIRWVDLYNLFKEVALMGIAFVIFGAVAIAGFIYTTAKHLVKGDYSLSKQFKPIVKAVTLSSDGIANAWGGELLNDVNNIPKDSKIKYGTWYQTISAVTGVLNNFNLSINFGKFIDKILGKKHCENAITKEQHKYYFVMKKLLTILLILSSNLTHSQFTLGVYQDIKLAIMSDSYGNTPYTADLLLKATYVDSNNISGSINYEIADLSKLYQRYSLGLGYQFKVTKFTSNVELETGVIKRDSWHFPSFGGTATLIYNYKSYSVGLLGQWVDRSDINSQRFSVMFGMKYKFKQ